MNFLKLRNQNRISLRWLLIAVCFGSKLLVFEAPPNLSLPLTLCSHTQWACRLPQVVHSVCCRSRLAYCLCLFGVPCRCLHVQAKQTAPQWPVRWASAPLLYLESFMVESLTPHPCVIPVFSDPILAYICFLSLLQFFLHIGLINWPSLSSSSLSSPQGALAGD